MAGPMKTLFKDAVVTDISGAKSGKAPGTSIPYLPSGIPGRSGSGTATEVLYDTTAPNVSFKDLPKTNLRMG